MSTVGQIERATQNRVIMLLREQLGYTYLGNWEVRQGNSNIEERYVRRFLNVKGTMMSSLVKLYLNLTRWLAIRSGASMILTRMFIVCCAME